MSYGPRLTAKQKAKLEAEIKAFNEAQTLAALERNSLSKKDIPAYIDWLEQNSTSDPDRLAEIEAYDVNTAPDLKFLSTKLEIDDILSFRQRQVWKLCMREGMSAELAAEKLNISLNTVKSYLRDSIKKVREHFKHE